MKKLTFNNFLRYILKQKNDKRINNADWNSCAVGDFVEYCGKEREWKDKDIPSDFSIKIKDKSEELYNNLNFGCFNRYNQLKNYLKNINLLPPQIKKKK